MVLIVEVISVQLFYGICNQTIRTFVKLVALTNIFEIN